ncbi:hypothetical protein [Chryseobacterium indoltheticum]|uniref:hypothetical protein n=1 Tax=Chryseobacterium indoltheticum TaxID=254 RepID=UPI003F491A6D
MFEEIDAVRNQIKKFDNISFSIFYHDIIYDASSKLNEEKSADIAKERLQILGVNNDDIQRIYEQILTTKSHKNQIMRILIFFWMQIYQFLEKAHKFM